MNTTWTEQDEATLRELTERKMRFTDEAKEPLREILARIDISGDFRDELADALIKHAAELRDALEPFDLRKPQ